MNEAPTAPPSRWQRARALDHRIFDPAVAIVLLVIACIQLAYSDQDPAHQTEPNALGYLLSVIAMGALAFRTRAPRTTLAVVLAATTWYSFLEYPENGLAIACMIGLYTVAALTAPRRSAIWAGIVFAILVVLTIAGTQGLDAGGLLANTAFFGIAYAGGSYVRVRRAYTAALEQRALDVEEARRREAEQAVAQERLRIARELHDVVAHAMSVVAVQSGVAAHVIDHEPDQARSMLQTINSTSREALTEMRRLLGVLRSEDDPAVAELVPAPSLDDLDSLVSSVESTGVTVAVTITGTPRVLSAGVDLAAYRVVQEALTNVVRHAGAAHATVRIAYEPDALLVAVADDGLGAATRIEDAGGGHGLVGMRERVELYGGTLEAGPRPGGGFAISAALPLRTDSVVV